MSASALDIIVHVAGCRVCFAQGWQHCDDMNVMLDEWTSAEPNWLADAMAVLHPEEAPRE